MTGRPSAGAQDGFTLVELLVAMTLMAVVLTASLSALTSIQRSQRSASDRADTVAEARAGIERMTRELRQGASPTLTVVGSAQRLDVTTWVHPGGAVDAQKQVVRYVCTPATNAGTCTRQVVGVDTAARPVLTGLTNGGSVFTLDSAKAWVEVTATVALESKKTITFSGRAGLRNAGTT